MRRRGEGDGDEVEVAISGFMWAIAKVKGS